MGTHSCTRRRIAALVSYLYSTVVAGWLLSILVRLPTMNSVEWTNAAILVGVVLGSTFTAVALWRAPSAARYTAFALGLVGLWLLGETFIRAVSEGAGAGPGLVISYVLILSLWSSLVFSLILVASCASSLRSGTPPQPKGSAR